MLAFVPWPPLYERVPGETLGLFDLEPEATPNVWRALGRDLARLHTFITPALLPPEEVGQCDDLRAAPYALADGGVQKWSIRVQFSKRFLTTRLGFPLANPIRGSKSAVLSEKQVQLGRMFLHVAQSVELQLQKADWLPL